MHVIFAHYPSDNTNLERLTGLPNQLPNTLGYLNGSVERKTEKLRVCDHGNRAIPYEPVTGQFRPSEKVEVLRAAQG
jgi:hypothetical protein